MATPKKVKTTAAKVPTKYGGSIFTKTATTKKPLNYDANKAKAKPTYNATLRKQIASSKSRSSGGGIDVGKFLGEVGDNLSRIIPSRKASGIVPHTMKNLPKGGVQGVIKRGK